MRRKQDDADRWAGMKDGDEQTVELPFGEAVFYYDAGDPSVGINGGVCVTALLIGGHTFDREALEACKAGAVTLADALDAWAGEQ
jgi:hypothetical protein